MYLKIRMTANLPSGSRMVLGTMLPLTQIDLRKWVRKFPSAHVWA